MNCWSQPCPKPPVLRQMEDQSAPRNGWWSG